MPRIVVFVVFFVFLVVKRKGKLNGAALLSVFYKVTVVRDVRFVFPRRRMERQILHLLLGFRNN